MKARIDKRELWVGHSGIEYEERNAPQGAKWKHIWVVEVDCDSEREAMALVDELRKRKEAAA